MGTSTSYGGPTGENPLLPPWAPPPPEDDNREGEAPPPTSPDTIQPEQERPESPEQEGLQPQPAKPIPWAIPKRSLSLFASSKNQSNLRSAIRGYVRAQGGSRRAAHAARAGRTSAQRLGGFLSSIVNEGIDTAARSLGLQEFIGQDANVLLATFVDQIAPDGALLEEAAAREATIQTLDELFQEYVVGEDGLDGLNALDSDGVQYTLERYLSNYIYTRLIQVISQGVESRGTDELIRVENEVKDYVFSTVHLDIINKTDVLSVDWNGQEGHDFVERIYQEGHELIETLL